MSRSIRNRHNKNGVKIKWCGNSNKKDKRLANRKFRRHEHINEKETLISKEDEFKVNDIKDVSDIYNFRSDGSPSYVDFSKSTRWRGPIEKDEQYKYKNK